MPNIKHTLSKLMFKDKSWLFPAAILAVASVWIPPTDPSSLEVQFRIPLICLAVASCILGFFKPELTWVRAMVMVSAVCLFRFAIIVIDGIKDPTSHNLFPFEILITGIYSFAIVFPGGYLGVLIRKIFRQDKKKDKTKGETNIFAIGSFVAGISSLAMFGATLLIWDYYIVNKIQRILVSTRIPFCLGALALALGVFALIMRKKKDSTNKNEEWALLGIFLGPSAWLVYIISRFFD